MRISIVTTCRNAGAHIGEAIESAASQRVPDLEHIVTDAASTDGTLAVLAQYPHLRIDSRPDRGIYDGLDRGLAMATGDIVGFLNADDWLEPGALAAVAAAFRGRPDLDILTGGARVTDDSGAEIATYIPRGGSSVAGLMFGVPLLNARFFSRGFIARIGGFDLTLPTAADRDWLLRAVAAAPMWESTRTVLYRYRAHAGSTTLAGSRAVGPRLWREHVALADAMLAHPAISTETAALCRRWRAVEAAKLAIRGDEAGTSRWQRVRQLVASDGRFAGDLAAGLVLWRRHRGRHADG